MASNTTRSRDRLLDLGYAVDVCEYFNYFTKKKRDLFSCFDLVGFGPLGVVLCQTTSRGNISARIHKIEACEALDAIRKSGASIVVDGWDQPDGPRTKWRVKTVDVS